MKQNFGLLLTEEQEKALERAYSEEQFEVVIDYLYSRKTSFNPWLDIEGNWFNQTDQNGKPIEGEAAERLWSDAVNKKTRLNSTYRLTPFDRVRFILTNNYFGTKLWDLISYILRNELIVVQEEIEDVFLDEKLKAILDLFQNVKKELDTK